MNQIVISLAHYKMKKGIKIRKDFFAASQTIKASYGHYTSNCYRSGIFPHYRVISTFLVLNFQLVPFRPCENYRYNYYYHHRRTLHASSRMHGMFVTVTY